jgi:hypothetical protein
MELAMTAVTYSIERHEGSGELYIIEWTGGIDAPTAVSGPIPEDAFSNSPMERLSDEMKLGPEALEWYAEQSWTVVAISN